MPWHAERPHRGEPLNLYDSGNNCIAGFTEFGEDMAGAVVAALNAALPEKDTLVEFRRRNPGKIPYDAIWAYRAGSDVKIHIEKRPGETACGTRIREDWEERGTMGGDEIDCLNCRRSPYWHGVG